MLPRAYSVVCTLGFYGYIVDLALQFRDCLDANRDMLETMLQVVKTGQGPAEQIPSMGCSIKWKDEG